MGTAAVVAGTAEELKEDNQECLAECDGHGDGEAPNLIEHGFEFLMNPQLEANPIADRFPSLILFFILPPDGNKLNLVHNENPFHSRCPPQPMMKVAALFSHAIPFYLLCWVLARLS
ncbi:hypothetical protein U9M48_006854 [Paspalum notatum var. saurae]|uniref:Uncharacterized protein n=1 Tax=Paspalum notatum var. saurae TaxID=547442 RepID=A0AAQ3PVE9_PASNO